MTQPPSDPDSERTHFGYQTVARGEKVRRVGAVFDSVAERYDIMNDLMSLGIHRLWKRLTAEMAGLRPGARVLDLAGGTGDLTRLYADKVGRDGELILSDINARMLAQGRRRLLDLGLGQVRYVQANAERLPFPDNHFDLVSIGFGLRNVTDKQAALNEMQRLLRPGGRALILEFSRPVLPGLKPLYDLYSFTALPAMGRLVTGDAASYRYLAESIRMHPPQDELKAMMEQAGLEDCRYTNLSGGIVAIHRGNKY